MTKGVHIILLAAGSASRFGGAKQAAPIDGVAMVRRAAQSAIATGAEVIVVTGAHLEAVHAAVEGLPLTLVHNADWQAGMGGSIACGVRALPPQTDAAIIALADQPLVGTAQLRQLIDDPRRDTDRIIAAQHGETLGPPCLFPRRYFDELAGLSGMQGARKLLQQHSTNVVAVPMPEAAVDVDTREDYVRLTADRPG
jgi:molybdenum cofactor cytidylyltransferase